MNFISEKDEKFVLISNQIDLDELINRFKQRELFAYQFKFTERELFVNLLQSLEINYENFEKKYFYFDGFRKLHISESEFGYVWISTTGLIAKNKATSNRAVNSCINQYTVIKLLLQEAIKVIQNEKVYDVDSHGFGYLSELSPAIFHNLIFYVEVFCKAYLSLVGEEPTHTHKLSLLYKRTVETMVSKKHSDSLLQAMIMDPLYKLVDHIGQIPGNFKEQFVKYDDNPMDDTVILFESNGLIEMSHVLELSHDFIIDFFYTGNKTHYIKTGLFQRLLDKADTEEKKQRIRDIYPNLAGNNSK